MVAKPFGIIYPSVANAAFLHHSLYDAHKRRPSGVIDVQATDAVLADSFESFGRLIGHLTERGGQLMTLFGGYYGEYFAQQGLPHPTGCGDSSSISFLADSDQRPVATGKALAGACFPVAA